MAKKSHPKVTYRKKNQLVIPRGSGYWGLDLLRSDALPRFLKDLVDREDAGLELSKCNQVHKALQKLCIHAAEIPDKSIFPISVKDHAIRFLTAYEHWNSIDGVRDHTAAVVARRKALTKMISRRHAMATRIRKQRRIIEKDLDLKVVDGIYEGLAELPKVMPDIFKNLSKAVERYFSRK